MRGVTIFAAALAMSCVTGETLEVGSNLPQSSRVPADLAARCPKPESPLRAFGEGDSVTTTMMGRWFQCRSDGRADWLATAAGVEFASGNAFYVLLDIGEGRVDRSTASEDRGRWSLQLPSGPTVVRDGSAYVLGVAISEDHTMLRITEVNGVARELAYVHE